jgi:DNA-directed RNA polymerase specialized sigma24 family protein
MRPTDCELLLLDHALNELAVIDPQQAQIVELRYFGGLTEVEVANVLTVPRSTVTREWLIAKGWLYRRITKGTENPRATATVAGLVG